MVPLAGGRGGAERDELGVRAAVGFRGGVDAGLEEKRIAVQVGCGDLLWDRRRGGW